MSVGMNKSENIVDVPDHHVAAPMRVPFRQGVGVTQLVPVVTGVVFPCGGVDETGRPEWPCAIQSSSTKRRNLPGAAWPPGLLVLSGRATNHNWGRARRCRHR